MHPYPLEKLLLQNRVAAKLRRQLNIGNWTEDQAIFQIPDQALGGREPKLRIVLTNIEQHRLINDPSHITPPRLPAVPEAPRQTGAAQDRAPWRNSKLARRDAPKGI